MEVPESGDLLREQGPLALEMVQKLPNLPLKGRTWSGVPISVHLTAEDQSTH